MRAEYDDTMTYDKICTDNDEIDSSVSMQEDVERVFLKMIEYCEKNNIQLVLIKTPKEDWNKTKMQQVQALADQYGITFIDFNTSEMLKKTGIIVEEDMWDKEHLNIRGVKKLTDYVSEYLLEHYEISDGRKTKAYDTQQAENYRIDWQDKYIRSSYSLDELSDLMQNERYDVLFQTSIPVSETWSEDCQKDLEKIGLTNRLMDVKDANFVGQYSNGNVVEEHTIQGDVSFTGEFENGVFYQWDGANAKITIGEEEIAFNMVGVNVVVYDKQNGNVVDTFTIYYNGDQNRNMIYRVQR